MSQPSESEAGVRPERRSIPRLRAQTQEAFQVLIEIMVEAGNAELADQLKSYNRIEDAMKIDPYLVKNLIDLAWANRSNPKLAAYLAASDGSVAADESAPLGPCGEPYFRLRVILLRATARVFLTAAIRQVPTRALARTSAKAKEFEEENALKLEAEAKKSQGVVKRIKNLFSLDDDEPTVKKNTLRHLYPLLQDNLVGDHQFALIGDYAKLEDWQIATLGEVLIGFTESAMVLAASGLEEEQLNSLVRLARSLSNNALESGAKLEDFLAAKVIDDEASPETAALMAGQSLGQLLVKHPSLVRRVADLDPEIAEGVIKRMSTSLGWDTWSAFSSEQAVRNVGLCPDFLVQRLGPNAKFVYEGMAKAIDSVHYHEAAVMLIERVLERMSEKLLPDAMAQKNFKHWQDAFKTINDSPMLPKGANLTRGMAALRMADLIQTTYKAIADV